MAKVNPFHSIAEHADVHHDNSACEHGKKIKKDERREGKGGKPICKDCEMLD